MGQFSVEKPVLPGSVLSGNQHLRLDPRAPAFWDEYRKLPYEDFDALMSADYDGLARAVFPSPGACDADAVERVIERLRDYLEPRRDLLSRLGHDILLRACDASVARWRGKANDYAEVEALEAGFAP